MAQNLKVCEIEDDVKEALKKFRFSKNQNNRAIIMKISQDTKVVIDEEHEDILVDDLKEELPVHLPRFVALSYRYTHDDGRVSYPMCFIFISPRGCKPEMHMMYAGTKLSLVNAGGFTKVFELRSVEELTEDWLKSKLGFFR